MGIEQPYLLFEVKPCGWTMRTPQADREASNSVSLRSTRRGPPEIATETNRRLDPSIEGCRLEELNRQLRAGFPYDRKTSDFYCSLTAMAHNIALSSPAY